MQQLNNFNSLQLMYTKSRKIVPNKCTRGGIWWIRRIIIFSTSSTPFLQHNVHQQPPTTCTHVYLTLTHCFKVFAPVLYGQQNLVYVFSKSTHTIQLSRCLFYGNIKRMIKCMWCFINLRFKSYNFLLSLYRFFSYIVIFLRTPYTY